MIKDEYSPFKIVHRPFKLDCFKNGVQPAPMYVQILPINACNLNCKFCYYNMPGFYGTELFSRPDIIEYPKMIEIFDSLMSMGVKGIQFTGGGEPLLHPDIESILSEAFKRGFEIGMLTNGTMLDDHICDLMSHASWIRISVDALYRGTYEAIKGKDMIEKVFANINQIIDKRGPVIIGISYVVEPENYKEVYEAAVFFRAMGVDNIKFSGAITLDKRRHFESFRKEALELTRKAEELTDENFTVFNLFNERSAEIYTGQDYDFCAIKDLAPCIGADLNVYTCCILQYCSRGLIGSIADCTFEDFWNGPEKRAFFRNHNPRKVCIYPCIFKRKLH